MKDKIKTHFSSPQLWMLPFLLVIAFPCLLINTFSKNKWFCTFWGWHKQPEEINVHGISLGGTCPRCGKPVLCDSNGDWFD